MWLKYCKNLIYSSSGYFMKRTILQNKCISICSFSSDQESLKTYEISIKTCGALYEKWKQSRRYYKVPDGDLNIRVKYFDTSRTSNHFGVNKVVVALHGAPGSCDDYSILASYLHKNGVRFICPTFPSYSTFPPGIFRHTDEEKAQFVKDFLDSISVSKVDLLICHSGAVYPALNLCIAQNPVIKSIAMLNPATISMDMPSIKSFTFLRWIVRASEIPVLLKIFEVIGPTFMKMAKVPVKVDNFLDPLLSGTTMVHGNILQAKEKFLKLSSGGFPILLAFSENDKLMGKKPSYELADLLGANISDMYYINKNGEFERIGKETSTLKVMAFENGSHYVFWKYPDIINEAILKFLKI